MTPPPNPHPSPGCSDAVAQPLPVAAAANEAFKLARAAGHGDDDFSAVHAAYQVGGAAAGPPSAALAPSGKPLPHVGSALSIGSQGRSVPQQAGAAAMEL